MWLRFGPTMPRSRSFGGAIRPTIIRHCPWRGRGAAELGGVILRRRAYVGAGSSGSIEGR
jgi:acetyltransferase-like isoleucine patch superfamily enzyme